MTTSSRSISSSWFASSFDELYPIVYAHRTVAAAAPESEFAMGVTALKPGDRALDLACGNGRHMVHLLGHTDHVTGLDFSRELLCEARRLVGPKGRFVRGDMRALPFRETFDVVFNFFTSFGYFMDEAENAAAAQNIAAALRSGGRFFLDYMNPGQVRDTLVPQSDRVDRGFRIVDTRWIDEEHGRVNKATTVYREDRKVAEYSESVRLYSLQDLTALLEAAGLTVTDRFGAYDGSTYAEGMPRMILTGCKRGGHG